MTAQIEDSLIYEKEEYSITHVDGQGLFSPEDNDLYPYHTCTACWRGYIIEYILVDKHLILNKIHINLKEPIDVNGVKPKKGENILKYTYKNLKMRVLFTGNLIIIKDYIQEKNVSLDSQMLHSFRRSLELQFENGILVKVKDL